MRRAALCVIVAAALLAPAPGALATGGDEEMEAAALKAQPARTLTQQALAILDVRKDAEEARMRIDAALASKDQDDVEMGLVRQADEALDGGDGARAADLLNRALGGGPLPIDDEGPAPSGQALHNAGRAFEPNSTGQELIGAIAGLALAALGSLLLVRHRRAAAAR